MTQLVKGLVFHVRRGDNSIPILIPPDWLHLELLPRVMLKRARDSKQDGVLLPGALIAEWDLREGDEVVFPEGEPLNVQTVNDIGEPAKSRARPNFIDFTNRLALLPPQSWIPYDRAGNFPDLDVWSRVVSIGLGAQIIVDGPWEAGKTILAEQLIEALLKLGVSHHPSLGNPCFIFYKSGGLERIIDLGVFWRMLKPYLGKVPIELYYGNGSYSNGNSGTIFVARLRRRFELGYDGIGIGDSLHGLAYGWSATSTDTRLGPSGIPQEVFSRLLSEILLTGWCEDRSITIMFTVMTGGRGVPADIYNNVAGPGSFCVFDIAQLTGKGLPYPWVGRRSGTRRPWELLRGEDLEVFQLTKDLVDETYRERGDEAGLLFLQSLGRVPRIQLLEHLEEERKRRAEEKRRKAVMDAHQQVVNLAPTLKAAVRDKVGTVLALLKAAEVGLVDFLANAIKRLPKGERETLFAKLREMELLAPEPEADEEASKEEAEFQSRLASIRALVQRLLDESVLRKPVGNPHLKHWAKVGISPEELGERLRAGEDPGLIRAPRPSLE